MGRVGSLVLHKRAAEANTDVARSLRLGKQQGCFFSRDDGSWFQNGVKDAGFSMSKSKLSQLPIIRRIY